MRRTTEQGLLAAANGLSGGAATPLLRWRSTLAAVRAVARSTVTLAAVSALVAAVVVVVTRRRRHPETAVEPSYPATNGAGPARQA